MKNELTATNEVLFSAHDSGWGRALPVTLITYADGTQDLHRQTGADFPAAIKKARAQLWERGLAVGPAETFGATGAYLPVKPVAGK